MAPQVPPARREGKTKIKDKEEGLSKALISFSQKLRTALSMPFDDSRTTTFLREIKDHLSNASKSLSSPGRETSQVDLNRHGTDLWNQCIHLRRSEPSDVPQKRKSLTLQATALAFLLLALPHRPPKSGNEDARRVLMLAINAGRHCIAGCDFDLGEMLLKHAADYISRMRDLRKENLKDEEEIRQCHKLEAEYTGLRVILAWKVDRIGVAEYVYKNANLSLEHLDFESTERVAGALFEVGNGFLSRLDLPLASKWLERALEMINSHPIDQLSREGVELRIAITQALVQTHIKTNTGESLTVADGLITCLEDEIGDRPLVILMRLELLQQAPGEVFNIDAYTALLDRMVRTFVNSENSFKLILHHIKQLFHRSYYKASRLLDDFLLTKLVQVDRHAWAEKAVVTRIYMTTHHPGEAPAAANLEELFKQLLQDGMVLGPDAAMAGQSLIWNAVEQAFSAQKLDLSEEWCKLSLNEIFRNTGPSNAAKIARKMMSCALGKNDMEHAKEVFYSMPDPAQNEPETRYLLHKAAIHDSDEDLATECLEYVGNSKDDQLLYACVTDAVTSDRKLCAMRALKKLTLKYDFQNPKVNLPALLRCTIRTNMGLLKEGGKHSSDPVLVECLCETYEAVATAIQRAPIDDKGNKFFTVTELDWFCRNAYNAVLQHMYTWTTGCSLRLLAACLTMLSRYPEGLPLEDSQELWLKSAFCHFLGASLRLVAAREEDDIERQLQHYLEIRKHMKSYDDILQSKRIGQIGEDSAQDLQVKLVTLLVFDFEAAIALKSYEDLVGIVRSASEPGDLATFQTMGDALLCAKLPAGVMTGTMRIVVNQIWKLEHFDFAKLAKYFRCMFQAALPSNEEVALGLVDELVEMVKQQQQETNRQTGPGFPSMELQWMAAVSFNHGLDLYGAGDVELCRKWAERALNLAEFIDDGGVVSADLQRKWNMLSWEKE